MIDGGPSRPPRLLLVTGMSGAGKSTVLDALEDMGWDVVDNLPADLLERFVNGNGECRLVSAAVGMDVRSRGFDPDGLHARAHPPLQRDPPQTSTGA
jgi:RNase adapter protein RapZ